MRNGNLPNKIKIPVESSIVLTVPMRNGNEYQEDDEATRVSSYRTYEEWKLSLGTNGDPTVTSSYRTYEEWKRGRDSICIPPFHVLTVPMRNGNFHISNNQSANFLFLPYL